ncbi:MAG: hypothetical protein RL660_1191 [Bacteroidota bacterium]|jgi:MFS family permease
MSNNSKLFSVPVIVAALGYFVDIYDLQLFNIVGKKSLGVEGLNLSEAAIAVLDKELFLWQMGGMLLGGIMFGILGDKLGRKSVLFSSILIYSLANIANAYVQTPEQYAAIRLIAGFGLSGELGAAITLISEIMDREKRGWGTMIIVSAGALGAVAGNLVAKAATWQQSYIIGGVLGLALLLMRVGTFESSMFGKLKQSNIARGNFFSLFATKNSTLKYLCCILVGLPVWFVVGICVKFSTDFAANLGITNAVAGDAIMYSYIGLSIGDLASGWLSQTLRSRKKVVYIYLVLAIILLCIYLFAQGMSLTAFYFTVFGLGFATGFWALFASMAAEQFGTNIRATVATTVPNFVRGAVIPISYFYSSVKGDGIANINTAALVVGGVCIALSFIATSYLGETFAKDLDYYESREGELM